jgi:peptidoglycan/LPS O-acetylase OafA/YrhL
VAFSAADLAGNIIMWPAIRDLIVPMAWTLRHELLFYGLFSLAIVNRRLGIVVFAGWFSLLLWTVAHQTPCQMLTIAAERCITANAALPPIDPAWLILTMNVNLYFFVGMGLAASLRAGVIGFVARVAAILCVAAFISDQVTGSVYALALSQAFAFTTLVASAIWLSKKVSAPAVVLWLGTISYSFYLFHMTMMLVAHGIVKRLPFDIPWQVTTLLALTLALFASHFVMRFFEEPIIRNIGTWSDQSAVNRRSSSLLGGR